MLDSKRDSNLVVQFCFILFLIITVLNSAFASSNTVKDKQAKMATMVCLEIGETRKFESASRIRLVNQFRFNADLELFTEGDDKLTEYYAAGLCETLLLDNEENLKSAFKNYQSIAQSQKKTIAKSLMDSAVVKYELELSSCYPPKKNFRLRGNRKGEYMSLMFQWPYPTSANCGLNYHAPKKMGQEKALAQRVLFYLVEIEGIDEPLLFSGEFQDKYCSKQVNEKKCTVGFGHNFVEYSGHDYWGVGTSILDPKKKLGRNLKKKNIDKITLVLAGDINGYASDDSLGIYQRMDLFPSGKKIMKVIYEKK